MKKLLPGLLMVRIATYSYICTYYWYDWL